MRTVYYLILVLFFIVLMSQLTACGRETTNQAAPTKGVCDFKHCPTPASKLTPQRFGLRIHISPFPKQNKLWA